MDTDTPSRRRRKRSRPVDDDQDQESEDILKPTPSKKQRRDRSSLDDTKQDIYHDEDFFESDEDGDEYNDDDESEYELSDDDHNDSENTNTSNIRTTRNTRSACTTKHNKDGTIRDLRTEIKALKQENKKLKSENTKLKKLTTKNTNKNTTNNKKPPNEDKIRKKYFKKWSTRFPKVAAMKKTKFKGCSSDICVDEMGFDKEEFDILFDGKGYLVQPRPDNKPRSTVIIREFSSWDSIKELFGDYGLQQDIKVSVWVGGHNFRPLRYWGQGDAKIDSLNVHYNKSRKVLSLKFSCSRDDGDGFGGFRLWL